MFLSPNFPTKIHFANGVCYCCQKKLFSLQKIVQFFLTEKNEETTKACMRERERNSLLPQA